MNQQTEEWTEGVLQAISEQNGESFSELIREIDSIIPDDEVANMPEVRVSRSGLKIDDSYLLNRGTRGKHEQKEAFLISVPSRRIFSTLHRIQLYITYSITRRTTPLPVDLYNNNVHVLVCAFRT